MVLCCQLRMVSLGRSNNSLAILTLDTLLILSLPHSNSFFSLPSISFLFLPLSLFFLFICPRYSYPFPSSRLIFKPNEIVIPRKKITIIRHVLPHGTCISNYPWNLPVVSSNKGNTLIPKSFQVLIQIRSHHSPRSLKFFALIQKLQS